MEHCAVRQDKTGVVAFSQEDGEPARRTVQIPVSGLAVLQLGPGTSISTAALTSCTRAGATVMFTGGGGVPAYSRATPLTTSARWAIAQAKLAAAEKRNQRKAAVVLYRRQLGLEMDAEESSIAQMRGLEGRQIRLLYKRLAKQHKVPNFRRDTTAEDPINQGLNLANSLLYGCAAAACAALNINSALGIIHRGDARSLLFDLADLYKPTISIPLAFACADKEDPA
ncbi:CRISPR-associated endonuclease Cas1 [Corynebacterium atypicum]|uniref:CRISPR-associated endonuclease Cas1 n=1 Tax=Corynebacterium atypicum TaxID=191610 RepID=UPI0022874E78|nr:CRISPR-associated endonuclease Cas1 [Corynebacterium atypicum]